MNKDVIYIEPDDDITDIISKLKSAKEKVVALVPPKKVGVLRSAVNTKLIAKTAKKYEKAAVIVSTDPSLVKLAVSAGIPVAENLNSRPKLPSEFSPEELEDPAAPISIDERNFDDGDDDSGSEDESSEKSANAAVNSKNAKNSKNKKKSADEELNSEDLEKAEEKQEAKKPGKNKKGKIPDLDKHKKLIIAGIIAAVLLIGFLIWAFIFAPAAKISVAVHTTGTNFAENVVFVNKESDSKPEDGILYLETKEVKKDNSVDFTATGKKDVGEKAHGTLQVGVYVKSTVQISSGTQFTADGLTFTADSGATINFGDDSKCENSLTDVAKRGCLLYASINVTATSSGEQYNLSSGKSWSSGLPGDVKITNSSAFSGGTSKTITTVQQSDVDLAKSKLEESNESEDKDALKKEFGDDYIVIDSSYSVNASNPVSNPAVGAEVPDGTTPKLTASTVYYLSAVKKSEVEEFVKAKTEDSLAEDQKVYDIGDPFFEKFDKSGNNYVSKLTTTVQTGPKISEEEILEKAKGKKTGEVQSLIKSINGVSSVKVDTPFFWVHTVPNDDSKVEVELKVEE